MIKWVGIIKYGSRVSLSTLMNGNEIQENV